MLVPEVSRKVEDFWQAQGEWHVLFPGFTTQQMSFRFLVCSLASRGKGKLDFDTDPRINNNQFVLDTPNTPNPGSLLCYQGGGNVKWFCY